MENTFMNNKRENETTISNVNIEEEKAKEGENNINTIGRVLEALNTGDVSRVHEFISPEYFNHESQVDPVRSKLRGPEEFIDTVKNLRSAFSDLHYEERDYSVRGQGYFDIECNWKTCRKFLWHCSSHRT